MNPLASALPRLLLGSLLAWSAPAGAELPPEGRCPDFTGAPSDEAEVDQTGPLLKEGARLRLADILALEKLFPKEVWTFREAFLYEGMRMELGWCHRRYPTAPFYAEATEAFRGTASVDEDGNLLDYTAGLPFPPETIDPAAEDAARKWAWNFEQRYRGAGPVGRFRITDMPTRIGTEMIYEGEFYALRTGHRSDLAASDYWLPETTKNTWIAGGKFSEPFSARHLAWRQMRRTASEENWKKPDDTFVYIPDLRKMRRAAAAWIDGIYTPQYRMAGQAQGSTLGYATGGNEYAPQMQAIEVGAGKAIAATEDIRRGFMGLAIRPNAYEWEYVGAREVLAPINGSAQGWPTFQARNYGPSGLSVASDRWDVRYAVEIKGKAKRVVDDIGWVTLWIDYQTQQPLYFITQKPRGGYVDVGIQVHRFSGDQPGALAWPSGEPSNVFDPVAAGFYFAPAGGAGWIRESYDVQSVPLEPKRLRKLTTSGELEKGH